MSIKIGIWIYNHESTIKWLVCWFASYFSFFFSESGFVFTRASLSPPLSYVISFKFLTLFILLKLLKSLLFHFIPKYATKWYWKSETPYENVIFKGINWIRARQFRLNYVGPINVIRNINPGFIIIYRSLLYNVYYKLYWIQLKPWEKGCSSFETSSDPWRHICMNEWVKYSYYTLSKLSQSNKVIRKFKLMYKYMALLLVSNFYQETLKYKSKNRKMRGRIFLINNQK